MESTLKDWWVIDRQKTPDPIGLMYAGVVSRESVHITFTYTDLNGLDIFVANIRNSYLPAPISHKYYIICGPESRNLHWKKRRWEGF